MMSQQKEKGKLRNVKAETSVAQKLQEAQDEYDEVARLCVFRVKSLKEGLLPILLTQATRHHAAQVSFLLIILRWKYQLIYLLGVESVYVMMGQIGKKQY